MMVVWTFFRNPRQEPRDGIGMFFWVVLVMAKLTMKGEIFDHRSLIRCSLERCSAAISDLFVDFWTGLFS